MHALRFALAALVSVSAVIAAPLEERAGTSVKTTTASYEYFESRITACGLKVSDQDLVLAVGDKYFDGGKSCGKRITLQQKGNFKVIQTAYVVDSCGPDCGLSLSPALYKAFAPLTQELFTAQWAFVGPVQE